MITEEKFDEVRVYMPSGLYRALTAAEFRKLPLTDRIDLATLSPQDRTALRSIGRELAGVRRKLDYLASTSTFSRW